MAGRRRDSKHRVLRRGESIRADGKYQFKYHVNGTPHFVYSWNQRTNFQQEKSPAYPFGNWKSRSAMIWILYLILLEKT